MNFSIGEFSRISQLSIKSLRLYHEKGILIPAEVDEFTGYRYYNDDSFEIARSIRILRDLDFSLAEIKEILDDCQEEEDLMEHLQRKVEAVKEKINRYKQVSRSLQLIIQAEREIAMGENATFDVEEKEIATVLVAGHRMKGKYSDIGKGIGFVCKKMGRHINGKPITLYYDCEYKEEDADFETCMPVRKGTDQDGISVRELKGGKAITLIHKGPYDTLSDSYRRIMAYMKEKNLKIKWPNREVYLKGPGMILKGNPKNYLTEIQLLIEE